MNQNRVASLLFKLFSTNKNTSATKTGPGDFYPPIVISKVQNLYAAKGETKEIVCELGKNDNAWKIEWYFIKDDLITVLESSQDNSIKIEKIKSAVGEKLIINNVQVNSQTFFLISCILRL